MNTNQKLDPKQESIVAISTLTAIGNTESLKIELNRGLGQLVSTGQSDIARATLQKVIAAKK